METTKEIIIEGIDSKPIVFTIDAVVSQWHADKMNEIYQPYMKFWSDEQKQLDLDGEQRMILSNQREAKLIEVFVKKWTLDIPPTVENIKKSLLPDKYLELLTAINEVNEADLSEEKKSPLPNNSSSASVPTETPKE